MMMKLAFGQDHWITLQNCVEKSIFIARQWQAIMKSRMDYQSMTSFLVMKMRVMSMEQRKSYE